MPSVVNDQKLQYLLFNMRKEITDKLNEKISGIDNKFSVELAKLNVLLQQEEDNTVEEEKESDSDGNSLIEEDFDDEMLNADKKNQ